MDFLTQILRQKQKKKKISAVGVYIGPESFEIAHISETIKGISIIKNIFVEIPKKDLTADIIRGLFHKAEISETTITTSVPEEIVMIRRFAMPYIGNRERAAAIGFEAKRHIPFNINEVVSSHHIISEDRAKNHMDVLFAAAKREDIHSAISLLSEAGLKVEQVEPVSLALIKVLSVTKILDESSLSAAILYFSSKTRAEMFVAENGIPHTMRDIPLITKDIKFEEHLINEIRLTAIYYKREFPDKNIKKLIICGLRSKPEWLEIVQGGIGMPIEHALPLMRINGTDITNPQCEVSIGLAACRTEMTGITLNLHPEELIFEKYNIKKMVILEIAMAICIMGLIYVSQIPPLLRLRKEIKTVESRRAILKKPELSVKSLDELNTLKTSLQEKRQILSMAVRDKLPWHAKLKQLAKTIPAEIWINELSVQNQTGAQGPRSLSFKGTVFSKDSSEEIEIVNNLSTQIREDVILMKDFKNLKLGAITKTKIDNNEVAGFDMTLGTE